MIATFGTAGYVETDYNEDETIKCYRVSRANMKTPIRLLICIPEYFEAGHSIKIDKYGNPWVKK